MKKLYAVIGDPIAHSMSPSMHNDLFNYYTLNAHYHPLQVKKENLKEAVNGFRAIGISGFNVTIPHKTEIIPFLDKVDPLALQIGAVNTVVNENGTLIGYNTDGLGFQVGLNTLVTNLLTERVLIIGSGGAAKAIFYTLAQFGVNQLDICNRTVSKAEQLIESCSYKLNSKALHLKEAEEQMAQYSIVIQTTNIGMSPKYDEKVLSLYNMEPGTLVSDIIYNPL